MDKDKKKNKKEKSGKYGWAIRIFFISIVISAVLSLTSDAVLDKAGYLLSFLILFVFISLGILFDIVGVAVTSADPKPFHSMAAHKEAGAREALRLLKSADHVSSFCNDVVGDICGIVSGTTGAVIVARLQDGLGGADVILAVVVTALVSGLTIGGKAVGKNIAINSSTKVVYAVGKVLHFFHCFSDKRK